MKVYLIHYLREQDIYYNDVIYGNSSKAIDYLLNTFTEYINDCIEGGCDKRTIQHWYNDGLDYFKKCISPNKEYYPMYGDMHVLAKIPDFGYIQEFEVKE